MFKLYYLADQSDVIDGAKTFQGNFTTAAAALGKALEDQITHYSIEQDDGSGSNFSIILLI